MGKDSEKVIAHGDLKGIKKRLVQAEEDLRRWMSTCTGPGVGVCLAYPSSCKDASRARAREGGRLSTKDKIP